MTKMLDLTPIAARLEKLNPYGQDLAREVNAALARRRRRAAARRALAVLAAACAWVGLGLLLGILVTRL